MKTATILTVIATAAGLAAGPASARSAPDMLVRANAASGPTAYWAPVELELPCADIFTTDVFTDIVCVL